MGSGIERILVPGWDLPSSHAALELAERYPDVIQAAVGIHPHDVASATEQDWDELEGLGADPRCKAIGEIGLDYHRLLSPAEIQREAFARQLELAGRRGLPVVVHDREAHTDVTEALIGSATARGGNGVRGVLHAFSGDAEMATSLAAQGYLVSFALPVAFRSATGPRAAAAALPLEALLIETDSPYLGPVRERRNEPTTAIRVAAELARIRGTVPSEVAAAARSAYARLTRMA